MPKEDSALNLFKLMFQAHPWHGIVPGKKAPETVNAFIEIVPTDAVKYELDKQSGHLHVDRPQRFRRWSSFTGSSANVLWRAMCRSVSGTNRMTGKGDGMRTFAADWKTFPGIYFFRPNQSAGCE